MSTDTHPKHKIFISYAHEDIDKANRLFTNLKDWNLDPWLDQEFLLPGMKWEQKIEEAIKDSRYFIPLLSKNSTDEGYAKKELNDAREIFNKYTKSEIYIIPVRIDDCQILDSTIQELHIVDLFPDWNRGLQKILLSMDIKEKPNRLNEAQWANLVSEIEEKKCIPFIGEGALEIFNSEDKNTFLTSREIAGDWSQKYGYPLEDFFQLPKVAQFLAIEEGEMFPKLTLSGILKKIPKPDFKNRYRKSAHAVLAKLGLPIYITTNYDHFMEEALKSENKNPDTEWCRWNDDLIESTKDGTFPSLFDEGSEYKGPTENQPLVYHVHGSIDNPGSMVLTERDYFTFVINMNKIEEESIRLPKLLRTKIPSHTLLFIGYGLEDKNFLSILQGVLSFCSSKRRVKNTFAVIQIPNPNNYEKREQKLDYLKKYTSNMFNIVVYWGTTDEFVDELQRNWNRLRNEGSNGS